MKGKNDENFCGKKRKAGPAPGALGIGQPVVRWMGGRMVVRVTGKGGGPMDRWRGGDRQPTPKGGSRWMRKTVSRGAKAGSWVLRWAGGILGIPKAKWGTGLPREGTCFSGPFVVCSALPVLL